MQVSINVGRNLIVKVGTCDYQVLVILWKNPEIYWTIAEKRGQICLLVDLLTITVIPLCDVSTS